ncbi:class I adenylate-forming enzyme family protein [Ferrovibrio sp.]|uniref:class I adenylate-forming enzyme family protein n=1 Tax=Ferrovibrio sp. TaxID=1917215 RepID=UPI0025C059E9|nr:class I adenylate-forming enzyme family protein [Ferrovibrio sp.]
MVNCFRPRSESAYGIFASAARKHPDAEALVGDGKRLTYSELVEAAGAVAARLKQLGIRPGMRVAMYLANRIEFVTVYLGILRLGAVAVPMDVRLKGPEIAHVVNHSDACVLLHEAALSGELPNRRDVPRLSVVVPVSDGGIHWPDEQIGAFPPEYHVADPEGLATLLYTSGTTGLPKGAMLTHLNFAHSVIHFELILGLGQGRERTLLVVPASHVTGLLAILSFLWVGGAVIMSRAFKAPAFLKLAADERITHTVMVPAMYNLCLLQPDFSAYDLSNWRLGHFGGSPMPMATIQDLADRLPQIRLIDGYGATECCSPVALSPPDMPTGKRAAIGLPVHCADIRIVGPDGAELPGGETGEIWIRGPMIVPGYLDNAEANKANFTHGFWHSGDIGKLDDDGYLYISDRIKDVINRGGYKIYSVEVEGVLNRHPDVLESAVVSKPCPVLGERVHAFVTAKTQGLTAEKLFEYCVTRLADYKQPETYMILDTPLPRNSGGKVLKRDLRNSLNPAGTGR